MCGIAGIVSPEPEALRPIGRITAALAHRGPDDEGYLFADSRSGTSWRFRGPDTVAGVLDPPLEARIPEAADLALGHRRLSILDLSAAAHGPMGSADGRLWVTYNGEIYNYLELRDELRGLGHSFRTGSDTEVLLAAYAQWGAECLHRFNGMWAFALYDSASRRLVCARDRFGVKPFYYHWNGATLVFASEIKGLLEHPAVPRRANDARVVGFLCRGAIDESSQTFFAGIAGLPAGHILELDLGAGRLAVRPYYELPPQPAAGTEGLTADAFGDLLEDAVRLRLRSDVELGTCLSGGLDSSTIVAVAARLRAAAGAGPQRAFSVVYADAGLGEAPFVDAVLASTGALGTRATPTSDELARDLAALVRQQDEPIPSAGVYSQWRVMALARDAGVKVLLDGQGADEILAGYHYQLGPFLAEALRRHGPWRAWREARALNRVTALPTAFLAGMAAYHGLPIPPFLRRWAVARFSSHGLLPARLLDPDLARRHGALAGERHEPRASLAAERRADVMASSLPALLRYEDRNSMAFGIEARTPYLDYRLVEAALALPPERLVHDGWTKWILRQAAAGVVPEAVRLRRDKLGFATPERRWLEELMPILRERLGAARYVGDLLQRDSIEGWLGAAGPPLSSRPGIFRLLALETWHSECRLG
jgi:asparagine synthase (glutamine-hydrolysing)